VLSLVAAQLLLLAPGAPPTYHYRSADGVEHFVGSIEDVPAAQRNHAGVVDLRDVTLNPGLAEDIKRAKADEVRRMTPSLAELAEAKLQAVRESQHLHPGSLTSSTLFPVLAVAGLLLLVQAVFFFSLVLSRPKSPWLVFATFLALVAAVGGGFYLWSHQGNGVGLIPPELDPLQAMTNARRVRDEVNKIQQQRDHDFERALQEAPPRSAPPPGR
jgi:hypothetical protein